MKLTSFRQRAAILTIATALSAAFAFGETISVAKVAAQQEGRELISRVQAIGRDMQQTADQLQTHGTIRDLSKQTRAQHLNDLKWRTNNELRPAIVRLTEIRGELPEWQQGAVDNLLASSQAIAKGANLTILQQNSSYASHAMLDTEYKELVAGIVGNTGDLVQTADAASRYASGYDKAVEAGLKVAEY